MNLDDVRPKVDNVKKLCHDTPMKDIIKFVAEENCR